MVIILPVDAHLTEMFDPLYAELFKHYTPDLVLHAAFCYYVEEEEALVDALMDEPLLLSPDHTEQEVHELLIAWVEEVYDAIEPWFDDLRSLVSHYSLYEIRYEPQISSLYLRYTPRSFPPSS